MTVTPPYTRDLRILEIKYFLTKMLSKTPLTVSEWLPAILPSALFSVGKTRVRLSVRAKPLFYFRRSQENQVLDSSVQRCCSTERRWTDRPEPQAERALLGLM